MTNAEVKKSILRGFALAALATLMTVLGANSARAQWTTSGNTSSTTNNVGIGTTAPSGTLEVQGPDGTLALSQPGVAGKSYIQAAVGTDLHMSANARWTTNSWARLDPNLPSWNFFMAPSAGADFAGLRRAAPSTGGFAWVDIMRITDNGNIGIGTTTPTDRLEINGNVRSGAGLTVSTPGTTKYRIGTAGTNIPNWGGQIINAKFNEGPNDWTLDDTSLGAAFFKLDLRPMLGGNEIAFYRLPAGSNPRPDSAWTPIAQFKLDTGNVLLAASSGNVGIGTGSPAHKLDVSGNMTVGSGYTSSVQVPVDGLIVQGGVGIGTPTPSSQYKLDVVGDIRVSGNINAKYQDVAEWVPTTQKLAAGTVVVLDPERTNHVLASTASYDTAVAGVVSEKPGLMLGEAGEGKTLVATTGRVKVKVDATRAPIRIGDLLVTGDAPGVAMKSEPVVVGGRRIHAPGTIIGKALESLDKGTGEILVLLSLQ